MARRRKRFVAKFSGICPLCSTYIRAGQSEIARLPEPMPARMRYDDEGRCYSYDTGEHYHADCRPISEKLREWGHRDCVSRYGWREDEGREDEPLWLDAPASRRRGGNDSSSRPHHPAKVAASV